MEVGCEGQALPAVARVAVAEGQAGRPRLIGWKVPAAQDPPVGRVQSDILEAEPFVPAAANEAGTGNLDAATCSFRDKRLFGKVKVVESFPDVRVKVVKSFPDLKVKMVDSFADECGEWQRVDNFADFTIQYVESFPDIEISMVTSFPGPNDR